MAQGEPLIPPLSDLPNVASGVVQDAPVAAVLSIHDGDVGDAGVGNVPLELTEDTTSVGGGDTDVGVEGDFVLPPAPSDSLFSLRRLRRRESFVRNSDDAPVARWLCWLMSVWMFVDGKMLSQFFSKQAD